MKMTAGSAVFLDTNVLVYLTFAHFPLHAAARRHIAELERLPVWFWISRQVLREFLAVTTRPGFLAPLPPVSFLAATLVGFESRFEVAEDDSNVTALLLQLVEKPGAQGRQVHDANIVATMLRYGIQYLLTHNTSDFDR
jgi:predicted nucleic acid-binding protein